MYRVLILAAVFTIVLAPVVFAQQGEWTGNVNVFLGAKALNQDDWSPAEDQDEIGIKLDLKNRAWPVSIAIDYLSANGEGTGVLIDPFLGAVNAKLESKTSELDVGVRKIWDQFPYVRPFIGGGISFASAEAKVTVPGVGSSSDSDNGVGVWIGGGVYWTLAEHFNIGLELMSSSAHVKIAGVGVDAGGGHFGLLAGYHW